MSTSVSSASDPATTSSTSSSSSSESQSSATSRPGEIRDDKRFSSKLEQQSKLFRDLMSGGTTTASQLAELATQGSDAKAALNERALAEMNRWSRLGDDQTFQSPDAAAFAAVHQRVDQGVVVQQVAAPAHPDLTFAELVEKHVRRALASREVTGSRGGEIRIELSDAVLPGVAVSLKRTPAGWQLLAESNNKQSLDKLSQYAPVLVERFARASLGHLELSFAT